MNAQTPFGEEALGVRDLAQDEAAAELEAMCPGGLRERGVGLRGGVLDGVREVLRVAQHGEAGHVHERQSGRDVVDVDPGQTELRTEVRLVDVRREGLEGEVHHAALELADERRAEDPHVVGLVAGRRGAVWPDGVFVPAGQPGLIPVAGSTGQPAGL